MGKRLPRSKVRLPGSNVPVVCSIWYVLSVDIIRLVVHVNLARFDVVPQDLHVNKDQKSKMCEDSTRWVS